MLRKSLAIAVAVISLPTVTWAAQPSPPAPTALLRIHTTFSVFAHGSDQRDEELFVTSSRLVTSVVSTFHGYSELTSYWFADTSIHLAKQRPFATLRLALDANDVQGQSGDCTVGVSYAPIVGTYDLTWYDGPRRGGFSVQIGRDTTCPAEVVRIVNSIYAFAAASGVQGFGIRVDE
ncbi:MAG: hypothetical protein ABI609_16150 [Acidobacteriota bacterium]